MNMIIHDDGHTNIVVANSLYDFEYLQNKSHKLKSDFFDVVFCNPPMTFTNNIDKYISNFEIKGNKNLILIETFFIERCIQFLRPKGKLCIILPENILTNQALQYVRDYILKHTNIIAIVSLPAKEFNETAIKCSILFLEKKNLEDESKPYQIFMAIAEEISNKNNDLDKIYLEFIKFQNNNQ